MPKLNDLTGFKFGKLAVIEPTPRRSPKDRNVRWVCVCDCGKETITTSQNLRTGKSKSCGCLRNESHNLRHGHSHSGKTMPTATYRAWLRMRSRCNNPKDTSYANYGGRGIKVSERWERFENFLADMGPIPAETGWELDRIDVNGDYAPGNCRWIKRGSGQRSITLMVDHNGRSITLGRAAHELGLDYFQLYNRLYRKRMSLDQAIADLKSNGLT